MMPRKRKKNVRASALETKIKQPRPATTGLIISVLIALVLGGIPFGLGKYIEFNSPGPFDSGAYVYSAKHLLEGARLGVDEQSSARPGTLLANAIGIKLFGFNDTGPKAVQMVLQLAALAFMFYTLRKVFGSVAAVIGATVAAIYLSAPIIAKFGNVKEQFMIPFMIAAACCFLLYGCSQKSFWLVLSGFFALQPYYFKPTGLSIVIALGLCIILKNGIARKWRQLILELALFLAGFIVGLLLPGSLYLWQDMPMALLQTLPVVMLEAGIVFAAIIAALAAIIFIIQKIKPINHLRQVSKWIWIAGLCCIVIVLIFSVILIRTTPGSVKEDIVLYFHSFPPVSIPAKLYHVIDTQIDKLLVASGLQGGYISDSWKNASVSTLAPRVFRYYKALSVPILLAIGSIIPAGFLWIRGLLSKTKKTPDDIQSKLVWMLAFWWLLDMAFVWGSPRSYEQYYLPLCASGAMLSGYGVWKWQKQVTLAANKIPWLITGSVAMVILGWLTIPIFIGQRYSPDTGADYIKNYGQRRRGFAPALKELPARKNNSWIAAGKHIRANSSPDDTIYVWGWVPGIYVQAQRLAPVPKAFESNMHVTPPNNLKRQIDSLVNAFEGHPPKFIVDTRKQHFPNDRPPLELWPIVPPNMFGNDSARLLGTNPHQIAAYDNAWKQMLKTRIEHDEAERYEAMKPFRDFVMNNYKVAGQFGPQIVFERKN